ncbi:hypothetical protein [Acinetobacter gerneri]|jgi:hypothetical protein|uniref:Uncharacterized protein n=2 Tax=Acinetobacter gerneri TaxID=202952 RepID=N8YAY4_9GAMM|nr:hypothetical protein [Acinetobacter gerneri]ENV33806.1 hypothetical protein F960_02192 [Acinetobacter gerneri DSM 14967 = CIP 107464 = MTCC 9824]EPR85337.1 hypothetical protein L289_2891 [Acinetobacter gerneri DSM 14967 = CIP 107464 = MTCC 9824]MCH4243465.1 hypothetical protein [Acinetobacter gerneri]MDQ9008746.1 hypothetical protein [Acinetobacter gerneri]MDQ9012706.1 hypothetical protein [Acinetobacter gerneri]
MNHLAQYVDAIQQMSIKQSSKIIKRESKQVVEQESDTEVLFSTELYYFVDGAVIEKNIEQDQINIQIEACLESWIQYKVIQQPDADKISPLKIEFNSHCRESHWVKYFK